MDPNKPTYQFDSSSQSSAGGTPPPKKKMSKNLVIGLIVGGSIFLLIVVGAIFFVVAGKKSNSDADIPVVNNDDGKQNIPKKDPIPENFDPLKAKEIVAANLQLKADSNWSYSIRDQDGVNQIVDKNSQCTITSKHSSSYSNDGSRIYSDAGLLEARIEEIRESVERFRTYDVNRLQLATNSNAGGATVSDALDFVGKEARYDESGTSLVMQIYVRQMGKFTIFIELTCPTQSVWDSHAEGNVSQANQSTVQIQVEE